MSASRSSQTTRNRTASGLLGCVVLLGSLAACASRGPAHVSPTNPDIRDGFGVLVMAHGGPAQWNRDVLSAVAPLKAQYDIEVAFGMADAATLQEGVQRLEKHGARRIGVVRLFISGESFKERTEQILGIQSGAPPPPASADAAHATHASHDHGEGMGFWKLQTQSSFAMSVEGLIDAPEMGAILAERARALSREPQREEVLILAHGPEDDAENARWLAQLDARADAARQSLPFRRVQVETLREDWPEKRSEAQRRIRAFVQGATEHGATAIVLPFRVQGFGPYAEILEGLQYTSDGMGLIPHPQVTQWIERQIEMLRLASFRAGLPRVGVGP